MESLTRFSNLIRVTKPITRILGPEYKTTLDLIEIDVTYDCNLRCYNCNRSCSQAPSEDSMTVEQIEKFLSETRRVGRRWKRIRLLGGEPFLHPDIFQIIEVLIEYKKKYSLSIIIEISTNGFGEFVNKRLKTTPPDIVVNNSYKDSPLQEKFEAFNLAPCDQPEFNQVDYANACWITSICGMGLNMYGYYQCAVAAGIDRIMGLDMGLKSIPLDTEKFNKQKRYLCRYCGHFINRHRTHSAERKNIEGIIISPIWNRAYLTYSKNKPSLSRY